MPSIMDRSWPFYNTVSDDEVCIYHKLHIDAVPAFPVHKLLFPLMGCLDVNMAQAAIPGPGPVWTAAASSPRCWAAAIPCSG